MIKSSILLSLLIACVTSVMAEAQPMGGCASCVALAGCMTASETCVAECRARLFNIDPRRSECVTSCSSKATLCTSAAERICREQNLCQ
jgi:hypothetical protein